ncbi:MAG TPA: hypothetical protein VI584_08860, partial [Nitrospiria bacterium]|nr:hypothetical protein [Nitrospiria bacterium]
TGSFTWTGASSLPTGWTITKGTGTREITVEGPAINSGASASFGFTLGAIPTWTQDSTDLLDRIRASAASRAKKDLRNLTLFTRHALRIISMVAPATVAPGSGFSLVITVKNESSALLNSIRPDPNPPTPTICLGCTVTLNTPAPSPNPLSLAAGATNTITYNYTTGGNNNGTVYFTTRVRHPSTGSTTATSLSASSNTVVIGGFVGNITTDFACVYTNNTIIVTMNLSNFTAGTITNVTPSLTPGGTATKTLLSGPTPTPPINIAANGTAAFSWTYRIIGTLDQTYSFSGGAVGSSTAIVSPSSPGRVGDYTVSMSLDKTNATSTNQELTWTITNKGCAAVQSVSVSYPAGWTWDNDAYSLVDPDPLCPTTPIPIETWIVSGSNPISFSAPSSQCRILIDFDGNFSLVFSSTPTATGVSSFSMAITDANSLSRALTTTVTVNPFNFEGLNTAGTETYREELR